MLSQKHNIDKETYNDIEMLLKQKSIYLTESQVAMAKTVAKKIKNQPLETQVQIIKESYMKSCDTIESKASLGGADAFRNEVYRQM